MPCSHRHGLTELLGLMFLCSAVEIHVLNRFARIETGPKALPVLHLFLLP